MYIKVCVTLNTLIFTNHMLNNEFLFYHPYKFVLIIHSIDNVMYLSDIKSCVARTSIGAQFLSVGAQFLSVGAQFLSVGAQDAPACYGLCVK